MQAFCCPPYGQPNDQRVGRPGSCTVARRAARVTTCQSKSTYFCDCCCVQAVTLTGWVAVIGMAALLVLTLAGGAAAWKHYKGVPDASTVVLKMRPQQYKRVPTAGE